MKMRLIFLSVVVLVMAVGTNVFAMEKREGDPEAGGVAKRARVDNTDSEGDQEVEPPVIFTEPEFHQALQAPDIPTRQSLVVEFLTDPQQSPLRPLVGVLPEMEYLQRLELTDCNIGDKEAMAMAPALRSLHLKIFSVYGNHVTATGLRALMQDLDLWPLLVLNVGCNPLNEEGAVVLAHALPDAVQLQKLLLEATEMDDTEATVISLAIPPTLMVLDVSHNAIGDVGARIFALRFSRAPLHHLEVLNCSQNEISPQGATSLLGAFPHTKTLKVDLRGNPFEALEEPLGPFSLIQCLVGPSED